METNALICPVLISPVATVSHNRMVSLRSLKADLVWASGVKLYLQQGSALSRTDGLPIEFGAFALRMIRRDNLRLAIRLCNVVSPGTDAPELPFYQSQVLLLSGPLPKLLAQDAGSRRGLGKNHDSRGGTIKTMNEPKEWIFFVAIGQILLSSRQYVRIARMVGLGKDPCRLSNDQDLFVFVKNGHNQTTPIGNENGEKGCSSKRRTGNICRLFPRDRVFANNLKPKRIGLAS